MSESDFIIVRSKRTWTRNILGRVACLYMYFGGDLSTANRLRDEWIKENESFKYFYFNI